MKKPTNFACVRPKAGWSLIESVLSARSLYLSPCGRGRIASLDAIRVRGCDLSLGRNPSPQPSKSDLRSSRSTGGEGVRCRCLADQSNLITTRAERRRSIDADVSHL